MVFKIKDTCPGCFSETGYSIVLKECEGGAYSCPQNPEHRYKKDKDGFLIRFK
jgi:hypothetical protein